MNYVYVKIKIIHKIALFRVMQIYVGTSSVICIFRVGILYHFNNIFLECISQSKKYKCNN